MIHVACYSIIIIIIIYARFFFFTRWPCSMSVLHQVVRHPLNRTTFCWSPFLFLFRLAVRSLWVSDRRADTLLTRHRIDSKRYWSGLSGEPEQPSPFRLSGACMLLPARHLPVFISPWGFSSSSKCSTRNWDGPGKFVCLIKTLHCVACRPGQTLRD